MYLNTKHLTLVNALWNNKEILFHYNLFFYLQYCQVERFLNWFNEKKNQICHHPLINLHSESLEWGCYHYSIKGCLPGMQILQIDLCHTRVRSFLLRIALIITNHVGNTLSFMLKIFYGLWGTNLLF